MSRDLTPHEKEILSHQNRKAIDKFWEEEHRRQEAQRKKHPPTPQGHLPPATSAFIICENCGYETVATKGVVSYCGNCNKEIFLDDATTEQEQPAEPDAPAPEQEQLAESDAPITQATRSNSFTRNFIVFVVLTIVLWLGRSWWSNRTSGPSVKGDVYVITKGQSVVKIAGTTVMVLDMDGLRKTFDYCNGQLVREFPKYKERFDGQTSRDAQLSVWSEWHRRQEQLLKSKLIMNVGVDAVARASHKPTLYGFYTTATDLNGRFAFELSKGGAYMFLAFSERRIPGETERYCWAKQKELARGYDYEIHLDNGCERVSQESPDLIESQAGADYDFEAWMLARVMANEGFAPPVLNKEGGFW